MLTKILIIAAMVIVAIAVLVAVAYWWFFQRNSIQFSTTDGMSYILDWEERHTLDTRLGSVVGLGNGRIQAYLGVPYAEPPVGNRRFLPPVAKRPWEGLHDATAFPMTAWQDFSGPLSIRDPTGMSEDCLFLNVFTPSADENARPVLLWIHGGSYFEGSANEYDGSVLAEQGDVVVVAINYRLGSLGFLDLSALGEEFADSASNGIRDQLAAIKWVRDNIADYGGDPNNITLFGESAGGGSVLALIATPEADGLYKQAIVHSGGMIGGPPTDHTQQLAEHMEVPIEDLASALRAASPEELVGMRTSLSLSTGAAVDGTVITRSSSDAILDRRENGVPLIAGYNRDEGAFFALVIPSFLHSFVGEAVGQGVVPGMDGTQYVKELREAYPEDTGPQHFARIWSELLTRGTSHSAVRASAAGAGGWLYRFDMPVQQGVNLKVGATHGVEIGFTFNVFASDAPATAHFYDKHDPEVRKLALNWSNTIIQFAKTGNPNGAGLPDWPEYTAENREVLILDTEPRVESDLLQAERERWGDTEEKSSDFYL